jgi:hypothetical protein
MASATLLKSSFLPKKAEWGATRQVAAPKPTTVSMVARASAYADELVQTAVRGFSTFSANTTLVSKVFSKEKFGNMFCIRFFKSTVNMKWWFTIKVMKL